MQVNAKATRLLAALENGQTLTPAQIASRFRAANPYDLVYKLRNEGYDVKVNKTTNAKGKTLMRYSYTRVSKRTR